MRCGCSFSRTLQAWLFALYAGFSIPALRSGAYSQISAAGWRPRFRHSANAGNGSRASDFRPVVFVGNEPRMGRRTLHRMGFSGTGTCRNCKRISLKIASKSAIKITSMDGKQPDVPMGCLVYGFQERNEGYRVFHWRLNCQTQLASNTRSGLWRFCWACSPRLHAVAARRARRFCVVKDRSRTFCEIARCKHSCRRPHFHVRRSRRLVRCWVASISIFGWLDVLGGWRVFGGLDHSLWRYPGDCAVACAQKQRRFEPRGAGGTPLGTYPGRGTSHVLIGLLEFGDVLPVSPQMIVVAGLTIFGLPFAVNSSLHSYLILAYAGSKKGRRGCWLLLCCECRRAIDGNAPFRRTLPGRRPDSVPAGFIHHVERVQRDFPCASQKVRFPWAD